MTDTIKFESHDIVESLAAMGDERPELVSIAASAGTGKTYTLQRLVLDEILRGTPLPEILVVTFTKRAAAEMSIRIRSILDRVLETWAKRDAQHDDAFDEDTPVWTIGEEGIRYVERALQDFDKATITTIHSFAQTLLAEHAFETRQPFRLQTVDSSELFEDCFYDVLRARIAAGGTGRRWLGAWLHTEWKGLEQLQKDLDSLYSRMPAGELVLEPEFDRSHEVVGLVENTDDETHELGLEKEHRPVIRNQARRRFYGALTAEIERRKTQNHLLTFNDMLTRVRDALDDPSAGLLETIAERYDVALIDEFQDTDPVQWDIFRKGFVDQGIDTYLIGDEKQSIYSFRGADLNSYRAAVRDAHEERLNYNFRSTAEMISGYNAIFRANFFEERTDDVYPEGVDAEPQELRKERLWPDDAAVEVLAMLDQKARPQLAPFRERMADEIRTLVDIRPTLTSDGQSLEPGDIFVLTFSNREAAAMGDALADRGVPYKFFRKPGLFDTDECREIIELLRAVARPDDRSARRKAFIGPFFGVPLEDVIACDERDELREAWRESVNSPSYSKTSWRPAEPAGVSCCARAARGA